MDQHRPIVTADPQLENSSGRILRFAWALAVLAVAIQTAAHLTNELLFGARYGQLAAARDGNAFGWANTLAIASSALLVALSGFERRERLLRRGLLAIALVFLALDDVTGLHDRLRELPTPAEVAAAGAFAALLAVVLVLLWLESRGAGDAPEHLLRAGLLALAAAVATRLGAFVALGASVDGTLKAVGVAAEQGLDLGGWILVAAGLAGALHESADGTRAPP